MRRDEFKDVAELTMRHNKTISRCACVGFITCATPASAVRAVDRWLSHAGIVSKRLNLSENFFDQLVAPSFRFSLTPVPIPNSKGDPFSGGTKYTSGWGNLRFST